MKKIVTAKEIEESETLLDEMIDELEKNPEETFLIQHEEQTGVLMSVNHPAYKLITRYPKKEDQS